MLNVYDKFTLNSMFRPNAFIQKKHALHYPIFDIEEHVFLDKGLLPKY